MAVISRQGLITELLDRTELLKASTHPFLRLTDAQLHSHPAPGKRSIAEIYGHLNRCLDQYVRSILSRIALAPEYASDVYRSGLLGDWIYERIMPRPDGSVFPFKSLPALSPEASAPDGREELQVFQRHCDALDDILRHLGTKDIRRIQIPFSLNGIIRLRLGDLLRILVAYGERHLLQAQRIAIALA